MSIEEVQLLRNQRKVQVQEVTPGATRGVTMEEEEEVVDMKAEGARDRVTEVTLAHIQVMMAGMSRTPTMANTKGMTGNQKTQGQAGVAQDQQATLEEIMLRNKTMGMDITLEEEEGIAPEGEEKKKTDKMVVIEVIGVRAEMGGTMEQQELTDMVMEDTTAADKGGVPEDSARRLHAWGSLL